MAGFNDIRQEINDNIYENEDGAITGGVLNEVLNDMVDAMEDGNLLRAFKGWWPDLATLKAAITAEPGDSAYVKDASPATTWSIYVYSASATSDNNWANSGSKADTSNVQTFASGEEVNQTHIDDTHLDNPASGALSKAEDAMQLKGALHGIDYNETKISHGGEEDKLVNGETGNYTTTTGRHVTYDVEGYSKVRIRTIVYSGTPSIGKPGYYFYDSANNPIEGDRYKYNQGGELRTGEEIITVPQQAKYLRMTVTSNNGIMGEVSVYCYGINGSNIKDSMTFKNGEKLGETEIIDGLESNSSSDVLAAKQGNVLKGIIDSLSNSFNSEDKTNYSGISQSGLMYKTDGSTMSVASSFFAAVYQIEDDSLDYYASFTVMNGSNQTYSECVSVVYLGNNDSFLGYQYQADENGAHRESNVKLTVPAGTKKIYLFRGTTNSEKTELYSVYDHNVIPFIKNTIIEGNNSFYKEILPIKEYTSKAILKNDGDLVSAGTNSVFEYEISEGGNYTVDVRLLPPSASTDGVSIAYYKEDGTYLGYELPKIPSEYPNEERRLVFNWKLNIPKNAKIMRCWRNSNDSSVFGSALRYYPFTTSLFGKKICVVGDSISTNGVNTTPYIRISKDMVNEQITSYVTMYDVRAETTIGNIPLDATMVDGELHSFTPNSNDVGKVIGMPRVYPYNVDIITYDHLIGRLLGCRVVANASFSGSTITSVAEFRTDDNYIPCASWRDYTINRCEDVFPTSYIKEKPDVIIIYRGTNDFARTDDSASAHDSMTLNDVDLMNGLDYENINVDYTQDDNDKLFEFKKAYYMLINKLRSKYPKALIVCATLNVFKLVKYTKWPTRNYKYTLPDYNEAIRKIASITGCPIIEFDKNGITWQNLYSEGYVTDSSSQPTHPNQKGHWAMAVKAANDLRYSLPTETFVL